jgi:hypothetical protein
LAALRLVLQARLEDGLIFRRQRRLLGAADRLGLIPLNADAGRPLPLARQVGELRFLLGARAVHRHAQRYRERDGAERASIKHVILPVKCWHILQAGNHKRAFTHVFAAISKRAFTPVFVAYQKGVSRPSSRAMTIHRLRLAAEGRRAESSFHRLPAC